MAKHKPFNFQSSIRTGNTRSHTGKSPQTAIASTTSSAAGHPAALAFSPSMRDALYFSSKRQQPMLTPDAVRKIFGPAQTLGAPKEVRMAMDNALEQAGFYSLLQHGLDMGVYGGMANFLGYAALQNIAQNGLIRACIETVSDDMTRNWIEVTRDSEDNADDNSEGKDEALDAINAEIEKLELQKVMHDACSMTGYYGGCLLYLDTGASGDFLKHPLNLDPLFSMEAKDKGFLKAVRCIDPINVFPGTYNATNPLADDYYRPHTWWVLGKEVHASRLIRVVANEAPLIFKPSYNFLGIPQAQILWDYVIHFQANRDAANRLLNKFSMLVFKTAMSDIITNEGGLDQLDARMMLLARNQSNDGVFAIDRDNEDVVKVETPLSGVTDIVKQSLEQLAAMNRTPAVKLLGISPSGFNATGESDLRNYYDHVLSQQEKVLRHAIKDILDVMQISLFGEVDNSISFSFRPLSEDDKNAVAMTQQVKANTLCSLLDRDIISPEEARRVLIADPASGLNDLDPDEVPDPKDEQGMGGMPGMPGMGGGEPKQTPEGQVAEESDEVSLGRQLLGMDAEPEGEVQFRSMENGQPFPIKEGQTIAEAAKSFIDKKQAEQQKERTSKEYRETYEKIDNKKGDTFERINDIDQYIAKYTQEMKEEKKESDIAWYKERIAEFEKDKDYLIKDYVDKHEGNYHEEQDLMDGYGWEDNKDVYRYFLSGRNVLSNEELKEYGGNITSPDKEEQFDMITQKNIDSLSTTEKEALKSYTSEWGGGSYKDVNKYLWEGGSGNTKMDEQIKNISSALSRPLGIGITVERGVDIDNLPIDKKTMSALKRISRANFDKKEDIQKIKDAFAGKEFTNKGYTSTSTGSLEGFGQRPVKIIFKAPPKAHGLDITNLSNYGSESKFESIFGALTGKSKMPENEVLFDKGMRYKIDDVKFVFRPGYGKGSTAKPKGQVVLVATIQTD